MCDSARGIFYTAGGDFFHVWQKSFNYSYENMKGILASVITCSILHFKKLENEYMLENVSTSSSSIP